MPSIGSAYARIPKGQCEIRRGSLVLTSDDHVVGTVEGLLTHTEHIEAVVVRTSHGENGRTITLPIAAVTKVRSDEVLLEVDQ